MSVVPGICYQIVAEDSSSETYLNQETELVIIEYFSFVGSQIRTGSLHYHGPRPNYHIGLPTSLLGLGGFLFAS